MFSRMLAPMLVWAAGLLLPTADGLGQVIDDFEQGPFSLQSTVFDSGIQTGLTALHCIAPSRDVRLYVNGTVSGADLSLGAIDDEVTTVFGDGGGRLEFRYLPMPTDLTAGGVFNALRVALTVAVPAGDIEVLLRDVAGDQALVSLPITGPGTYMFFYSDFAGVDLGVVDFIQVNLQVPDFGDYHVSDIRPWEVPAAGATANVIAGRIEADVGAYPTPPLRILLGQTGDVPRQLAVMEISILAVTNAEAHGIVGLAEDSGPGDSFGEQALVKLLDPAPASVSKQAMHFRTIHMRVEFKPAEFLPQLVEVGRVNPFGTSLIGGIDHRLKLYYHDRLGNVVARGIHTLLVEGVMSSGLEVRDPVFTLPTPDDPNAFEVIFDVNLIGAGKSGGELPMVEMQLNGAVFDYESSTPVTGWTPHQSLALWAQPSVMSHETTFRLERGLDQRSLLQVFDVAGRRIRTLGVPAGVSGVRWDGRDERGRDVASGVYLARLTSGDREARAKLVKVR